MTPSNISLPPPRQRNPAWTREELILALHLYMLWRPKLPDKNGVEVKVLSARLNALAGYSGDTTTFRNSNGVYMKLGNFLSIDPDYRSQGKSGLRKNNKDEQLVWNTFADDESRLAAAAASILAFTSCEQEDHTDADIVDDGFVEAEEGRVLTRVHRSRERNRKLVRKFKEYVRAKQGSLICEGCGFEAADKYGIEFADVMDVHHRRPVHTLQPGEKTQLSDLAILCGSCHRVVHSRRKWLTIEQLQALVAG